MPQVWKKKKNPRFDRADAPVEDEEEEADHGLPRVHPYV
jgi:hypothetical protein